MVEHTQVAIVGGGPVGAALALHLGLRGIQCIVIEPRTTLSPIPKGQNLTQRTLEHFYFWDLADELRAARAMPQGYPIGELTSYGTLISKYWHAPPGRELVRQFYFQANERLPQYQTEQVLRRKLATLDTVETLIGWTAKAIEQDADGVHVRIAHSGTGATRTVSADYAVGCDGGHSMVREALGITRSGHDYDQPMLLAVFKSAELHEALKIYPERSIYRVMHPELKGYWQFFGRIDVGEGWFFHAPVPRDIPRESIDHHALLERATGFPFKADYEYCGFWDLRVAVADEYRKGRIFIAGDAAHTHPPYGGFGLNTGLEDAVNLGWKLTAVLDGWGGERLLDSYAQERRPVIRDTADEFIAKRIERDAAFLARYSPERDLPEFESAWAGLENDIGSRFQHYEPNYEGSSIVYGPSGSASNARGPHMFKARPGHHLAPAPLSSGQNVFERLGSGFTLLALDGDDASIASISRSAGKSGVPLTVIHDTFEGTRAAYEAKFILVRPDQFVAWSGDDIPANAEALIARVTGQ